MIRLRIVLLLASCCAVALAALMAARLAMPGLFLRSPAPGAAAAENTRPSGPIRFAVLGDSDSQSYHDTLMSDGPRGGRYHASTWQWTEALARLRGDQIDLGPWGEWGTGKYRAWFDEALGLPARTPAKDDYRYDFAVSGATCKQLTGRSQRQAIRLVQLMDRDPQAWRGGVVLIRIGVNDIGAHDVLDALSRDPAAAGPAALIDGCVAAIGDAVAMIRRRHPQTHVVLVGVLSNADWSVEFDHWQSARQIANIDAGLDRFDNGLRRLAAAHRDVYFLDDRAWFRHLWGSRDDRGRPSYKVVHLSPGWAITNTSGDDPHNAVLADGHAGTVWNALWAQHLVASLNAAFGLRLTPITDADVIDFVRPGFAQAAASAAAPPAAAAAAAPDSAR